jgi:hypothetical protein
MLFNPIFVFANIIGQLSMCVLHKSYQKNLKLRISSLMDIKI